MGCQLLLTQHKHRLTMKFAVVLLVVLPLAFANPIDKRGLLDLLGLGDGFDFELLKASAQKILNTIGSDATRQQCEDTCHGTLTVDPSHLLHTICSPLCASFQAVVRLLNLHPHPVTTVAA